MTLHRIAHSLLQSRAPVLSMRSDTSAQNQEVVKAGRHHRRQVRPRAVICAALPDTRPLSSRRCHYSLSSTITPATCTAPTTLLWLPLPTVLDIRRTLKILSPTRSPRTSSRMIAQPSLCTVARQVCHSTSHRKVPIKAEAMASQLHPFAPPLSLPTRRYGPLNHAHRELPHPRPQSWPTPLVNVDGIVRRHSPPPTTKPHLSALRPLLALTSVVKLPVLQTHRLFHPRPRQHTLPYFPLHFAFSPSSRHTRHHWRQGQKSISTL